MDLKTVDLRLVEVDLGRKNDCFGIVLQENVRQRSSEIRAIDIDRPEFGKVNLFTLGTENLESARFQVVAHANGERLLPVAQSARTVAEDALQVLVIEFGKASRSADESAVQQSVEVAGFLVNFEELLVCEVFFGRSVWGEDHFLALEEFLLGEVLGEPDSVEGVFDEVFVDLDEELVAFERAEPLDPAHIAVFLGQSLNVHVFLGGFRVVLLHVLHALLHHLLNLN